MTKELTLYVYSETEAELLPIAGKDLMRYCAELQKEQLLAEIQEMNELAEGGCYDSL